MAKRIALFNHKGGVSKTTTTFNLGWMLASLGHSTIIVDADPQCNLTGMVMGYRGPSELEDFYQEHPNRNIMAGLAPAFESQPRAIEALECVPVPERSDLFLLPGHIRLAEYEVTLGIAQELSGSIQTLQNLPGSISYLLQLTAERYDAEFILVDMSPGLGSINQNLFTTSNYFLVPTSPDFFSVMAIDSLSTVIPRWHQWGLRAHQLEALQDAAYPFPQPDGMFLGTVIQNYRPRRGAPASAFQGWIDEIQQRIADNLVPVLAAENMLLPAGSYDAAGVAGDHCLATIPDFNSLIARSQEFQTPVFALSEAQLNQAGVVLEATLASRDRFKTTFEDVSRKIVALTN